MPVQLNVNAPQRSSVAADQFGSHLSKQLSEANIDGKAKLIALRDYVDSKAGTAKIRVVNTTKNEDLAFRVKSFGHNKAYRQERTAETLKQLLTHAGVRQDVATSVVNRALQHNNGAYRTATASMIQAVLNDPAVVSALLPPPSARRILPPLAIKPLQTSQISPGNVLNSQFKSQSAFQVFKTYDPSARNLFVFDHAQGGRVEFRDLNKCDAPVAVIKGGTVIGEDGLYDEFSKQFPAAQKNPAPPRTYLLQEIHNGQAQGPCLLVPRDDLMHNPEFLGKQFKVLATVVPAAREDVDLVSAQAPGAFVPKSLDQYVVGATPPTFEVTSLTTTKKLDDFLSAQGLVTGTILGAGAFGSVKNLGSAPGSNTHAAKYFTDGTGLRLAPVDLTATRETSQSSEAYAAYLATSRDPQWQQPHVVAPSHYIVGLPNIRKPGTLQFELISISDLKKVIREDSKNGGTELKCYGLLMEKAQGQEITKQLETQLTDSSKRALAAQSGLQTLRTLNTRGFVHRDIKPDNLLFDGKDVSFIDTGLLFKIKKSDADKPNPVAPIGEANSDGLRIKELPKRIAGSPFYLHKDLLRGKGYIGTQADLHAFGLVVMEMEAPAVFRQMVKLMSDKKMSQKDIPTDPALFKERVNEVIGYAKSTKNKVLLASAQALQKNINDPSHLANLGFQCLEKANTDQPSFTAARWANRQFSDAQYAQLLNHPATRQIH